MNLLPDIVKASRALSSRAPAILSDSELVAVLDAGEILESYLKQVRAEAERRLESNRPLEGWELVPGRGRTCVMDTAAAFRALAPLLTERQFLDCCSVALGKLVDSIRAVENVTEDDAKDILGDYLKGNIMTSQGEPRLARAPKPVQLLPLNKLEEVA